MEHLTPPTPPCPPSEDTSPDAFNPVRIAQVREQAELYLNQAHSFVVFALMDDPPVGRSFIGFRDQEAFQQLVLLLVRTITSQHTVLRGIFMHAMNEMASLAEARINELEQVPDHLL